MDKEYRKRNKNKIYKSAEFLYHLLRIGQQNVAHTPDIFKAGILMLNTAFILYMAGFVSPYWVVGKKHVYSSEAEDIRSKKARVIPIMFHENQTHFGVWEECVVFDGTRVCSIFTEDVDSVILMFGCVGGFMLLGLCCWSCLSCVRAPSKTRYYFTVICAVIGGLFGIVSVIIFISVQGFTHYSWAFALFLTACLLELSAAAIFALGISWAKRYGDYFGPAEETETIAPRTALSSRATDHSTPCVRYDTQNPEDVEFITLDMVRPVPSQPPPTKRKKKRKRRRKKRTDSPENMAAVETLVRNVAEHHKSYINFIRGHSPVEPQPIPGRESYHPREKSQQGGTTLDERPASVYIDLTSKASKATPVYRNVEDVERRQRHSLGINIPQASSFSTRTGYTPRKPAYTPVRLKVEVHRADYVDDDVQEVEITDYCEQTTQAQTRGESGAARHPSHHQSPPPTPSHRFPVTVPTEPSHRFLVTVPTEPSHRCPVTVPTEPSHRFPVTVPTEPSHRFPVTVPTEPSHRWLVTVPTEPRPGAGGRGRASRQGVLAQDHSLYVRYSPDTYYQSRRSSHPNPGSVSDTGDFDC